MGQRLPAGQHIFGNRVQEHHLIQVGVAMHGCESLGHSATARIAMGTYWSRTPTMASQQTVATELLHRHQTIAELHQAIDD